MKGGNAVKLNNVVLGQFIGKCCDGDAVNNNGMYLSRELFDTLMASDDYKRGIENRYYIGFLGHPNDPNCMDFRNACVVMTEMHMNDDGEIIGTFDLVDTPTGKVVKAFIDAGVNFGISIRGAGDVAPDGTVDPDTFMFRGFDLVTFPAYNDCIPEFQEVAASSDADAQAKYRKVCAAVRSNLSAIESAEAIEIIKDQFNEHADEYAMLQERADEIASDVDIEVELEVLKQKVDGLTSAYVDAVKAKNAIQAALDDALYTIDRMSEEQDRTQYIVDSQNELAEMKISKLECACSTLKRKIAAATRDKRSAERDADRLSDENEKLVTASTSMKRELEDLRRYKTSRESSNLISTKKIEASERLLADKDNVIRDLESKLSETVAASEKLEDHVSNLEASVEDYQKKITASEQLIFDYQCAYADSCAYAAGVAVEDIPITSSTTVDELRSLVYGKAASGAQHCAVLASDDPDIPEDIDVSGISGKTASLEGLITL